MELLNKLRQKLHEMDLDGFIVPHGDEYQNEYLPDCSKRLEFLTGFSGSAGAAIVLRNKAAVFADGRYTIQVKKQVDAKQFEICHLIASPPADWLAKNAANGAKIGYDPSLHTMPELDRYSAALKDKNIGLEAVAQNPIDQIWAARPKPPVMPVQIWDKKYAGLSFAQKRAQIAELLQDAGCAAVVLTQPDSIAWLLNIRGADIPFNPLALSFAVLHANETLDWYINGRKLDNTVRKYLGNTVSVRREEDFLSDFKSLRGKKVWIDPATANLQIKSTLCESGADLYRAEDPCVLPKACKNKTEQSGMRAAHKRDGVAMAKFLHWLDGQNPAKHDEISVAEKLAQFRGADRLYRGDSFDTIAGFGKNGAIVHYRADPKTKSKLSANNILLLDSGAQYLDGTTDITRTISLGKVTAEQRDRFTRVLRGHIALATAQFPEGTSGSQLDSLARQFLWQAGLDYDHGTGHGVGCYLCVHEGPQRISKVPNRVALRPGMVISNEPGYYKTGEYGIRIENLIMVNAAKGKKGFLEFETLTLAPIDRKLVDAKMLSSSERKWLNDYHARVYRVLHKKLDKKQAAWLKKATVAL
ncbi:MAG: aminopeptidase P family protein [Alphaproteobacteria bacterium]|nr:MAG: aminopeptidase P family protein [Alphaproteobacteria bacterium]